MELWDALDVSRSRTGETLVRGAPMEPGVYHLVVHVCVFDRSGRMLIQRRQPFKDGYPGMWDVTMGGSAQTGETSQQAAMRELWEEVGIRASLEKTMPHLSVNFSHGFDDFFLLEMDVDETKLRLQPEEVAEVRWASREEILAMIEENTFIPYYPELIGLLFSMRRRYSSHQHDED